MTYTGLETATQNCGMNIQTGIFTASKPGLYLFSIHGSSKRRMDNRFSEVVIEHNGSEVARGTDGNGDSYISASALIKLFQSDNVRVDLIGGLSSGPGRVIYFQGVQLSQ